MTKIEWFEHLIELAPDVRTEKLGELQRTQPQLGTELAELLALDEVQSDSSAASSAFDVTCLSTVITGAVAARSDIPQFELLGLLGQGGMGEVWRAGRMVAGAEQIVALKILKLESDSAELRERFALEQRTLLKLVHPNIARLLDAGVAGDGRPWIAMELVQGSAITDYCDQHKLNIAARLKLFRQVIEAVQYAHDHFIVHRDIKPDNVLVDQAGTVKLLDFGIAKSLDRHAPHTLTQQRFFSLYATAPEQLLGSSVCVGTDIYALGGLLYELLSGAPLISRDIKTPAQLQSFIVEKTPTLPSKMADESAAANRSAANIAKLSANLRGDLDRIVLHALRKLPSERYASAREFDEDIAAYLALRPVKAAGQGRGYRTRKFLRRHWLAASVSALALSGLLTLTVLLGLRGNQLAASNVIALSQQTRAEQITRVLTDAFQAADPSQNRGNEVKAREVLDQAARRIKDAELDPDAFVKISVTLANVYRSLGLLKEGQTLAESAKLLESKVQSPDIRLQLLHLFARIYGETGQQALRVQTVAQAGKVAGVKDPELLIVQRMLEIDLISEGGINLATIPLAKQLDSETALKFGPTSDQAQRTGFYYADELMRGGRDQLALGVISERLGSISMDMLKPQHLDFIIERASIYLNANQYEKALLNAIILKNSTIKLFGKKSRKYVSALALESKIYLQSNKFIEAKKLILQYSTLLHELYPPNYPIHANALDNLASVQNSLGEYAEAERSARKALNIGEKNWGKIHRNLLTYRSDLAVALVGLKKYIEAESLLSSVINEEVKVSKNQISDELSVRIITLATLYSRTDRIALANSELDKLLGQIRTDGSPRGEEVLGMIKKLQTEISLTKRKD
jgi:eukaryotic-like serine/threonine-protein kinase